MNPFTPRSMRLKRWWRDNRLTIAELLTLGVIVLSGFWVGWFSCWFFMR